MGKHQPIAVRASTAASMLDLPIKDFMRLVADGALPPPVKIGMQDRWSVAQIEAVMRGDAAKPNDEFDL